MPRWDGELDQEALRAALGDLMARHESLRTLIQQRDGQAVQHILPVTAARPELTVEPVARRQSRRNADGYSSSGRLPHCLEAFLVGSAKGA